MKRGISGGAGRPLRRSHNGGSPTFTSGQPAEPRGARQHLPAARPWLLPRAAGVRSGRVCAARRAAPWRLSASSGGSGMGKGGRPPRAALPACPLRGELRAPGQRRGVLVAGGSPPPSRPSAPSASNTLLHRRQPRRTAYIGYRMAMRRQIVSTWKWVENNKSPLGNLGNVAAALFPPPPNPPFSPALAAPARSPRPSPASALGQGSVTALRRKETVPSGRVRCEGAAAGR